MKKTSRIISLLLALVLCLGALPAQALAAVTPDWAVAASEQDFRLQGTTLVQYSGPGGDVAIPNGVTSIGDRAFKSSNITSVTIPSGVISIGQSAFEACTELSRITISDSVTSIGVAAFGGCFSLTEVVIPDSVTSIGATAFAQCSSFLTLYGGTGSAAQQYARSENLRFVGSLYPDFVIQGSTLVEYTGPGGDVTIPEGVTTVSSSAFKGSKAALTGLTVPDSVTSFSGSKTFYSFNRLTLYGNAGSYVHTYANTNSLPFASLQYPDFVVTRGELTDYRGPGGDVVVPDLCTKLTYKSFANCTNLTSVTIPGSVTSIGTNTFNGQSQLKTVSIAGSASASKCTLAAGAFNSCAALERVEFSDGQVSFTARSFKACPNMTLRVPAGSPAEACAVASKLPYEDPSGSRDNYDFVVQNGVLTQYRGAGGKITLPDGVKEIGANAFQGAAVTEVFIPDTVTAIGDEAFADCAQLTHVTLSKHLTTIGDNIFLRCSSLTRVDNKEVLGSRADILLATDFSIKDGVLSAYHGKGGDVVIPNGVVRFEAPLRGNSTTSRSGVFQLNTTITSVTLPDSVTEIRADTFRSCTSLRTVQFGSGLKTIGSHAFLNCGSLTELALPSGLTSIGDGAFSNCEGLVKVDIPASVTSIGSAFLSCTSLTDVSIGNGDVDLDERAFSGCTKLESYLLAGKTVKVEHNTSDTEEAAQARREAAIKRYQNTKGYQKRLKANLALLDAIEKKDYLYTVVTSEVQALSDELCAGLETDREKLRAIHDWIVTNIYYDYARLTIFYQPPAQEVLDRRVWVCSGYASLFQAMAWAQKIPCVYVGGTAGGGHAWNAVLVDGEWLWVDATWDSSNRYYKNSDRWVAGKFRLDYFLCSTEFISVDHLAEETGDVNADKDELTRLLLEARWREQAEDAMSNATLSSWAAEEVTSAIRTGFVSESIQDSYTTSITREEFCVLMMKMITRYSGQNEDEFLADRGLEREYVFTDVKNYYVVMAYALGVVKGVTDTTFNPKGKITRQEAAAMLARTARVLELDAGTPAAFADAGTISSWAVGEVNYISGITDVESGNPVMQGTGNSCFSPQGTYTREQAIATALRLYRAAGGIVVPEER